MFNKSDGFAVALAWPETYCKRAGAWYDLPMKWLGFTKNGYYKVGHSALLLISLDGQCQFYDFGRYIAPPGYGRVRNAKDDHAIIVRTKARIRNGQILNLSEILFELENNPSTHGTGLIVGAASKIDYQKAFNFVTTQINLVFIPYGPFVVNGSNCSRFVRDTILKSSTNWFERIALRFPWMLTPSPMYVLRAVRGKIKNASSTKIVHINDYPQKPAA